MRSTQTNSHWTEPVIARFRELAAGGLDMRQCADALSIEFNISISRNACIGKSHRLEGFNSQPVGRPKIEIDVPQPPKPDRKTPRRQKPRRPGMRGTNSRKAPSLPPPRHEVGKVLFADLEPHQCRWPHGDGPYTFCGNRMAVGSWYCVEHFNIASPGRIR